MPKGMDPKAYAARVTKAKKVIAAMDPAMKKKLEQYYPKITKEDITKQMIGPKTTLSDMEKRMRAKPTATNASSKTAKTPMPKTVTKAPAKKTPMPKTLTGPAAAAEYRKQVSKAGVKKAEANAKKAIAKKYPDLTKKK